MDKIRIRGGKKLNGAVAIGGAKNAALKLMAASLLTPEKLTLARVPYLSDITTMANLLVSLGVTLTVETGGDTHGRTIVLQADRLSGTTAPYDIVRKMRASVAVLGPLLARHGHARVSLPGGCAIGTRPINYHLDALEKMGAAIILKDGYVEALAEKGLHGAEIVFPQISVGATENALMAATLARGRTVIRNAAREPEISDLAHCLNKMGANISGIDSDTLVIEGVSRLRGALHAVLPDRIEAGTYAVAAAVTGGDIFLSGIGEEIMEATLKELRRSGAEVITEEDGIRVRRHGAIKSLDLVTAPYPGLATDMQAQFAAMLCLSEGTSSITETIFENRFMHVPELMRMGADIETHGNQIVIHGKERLRPAEVMATDLRASVALVLAALATDGETVIHRVYHIDRGYERIEEKLAACGADIERIKE